MFTHEPKLERRERLSAMFDEATVYACVAPAGELEHAS